MNTPSNHDLDIEPLGPELRSGASWPNRGPALLAGARVIGAALARPSFAALALGAIALAALVAASEHRAGASGAATRALEGGTFGLLVPAVALGIVRIGAGGRRLEHPLSPLARFGTSRRPLAFGFVAAAALAAAAVGASLGAVTPWFARDTSTASIASDAAASAWIGALAGAAYAPLFALGETFGARGAGAFVLFFFDLFIGPSATFAAIPFPRAHTVNLLGGAPPPLVDGFFSQTQSAVALVAIGSVAALAALLRCAP